MDQTLEDRIRERAYHLWANSGGAGDDHHFWLMAEREVLAEIDIETLPTLPAGQAPETLAATQPAEPAPAPVQSSAAEAAQAAAKAPHKPHKKPAARKQQARAKVLAKSATKAPTLTVVETAPVKSATVTPLKPAAKAPVKSATVTPLEPAPKAPAKTPAAPALKPRARAGIR